MVATLLELPASDWLGWLDDRGAGELDTARRSVADVIDFRPKDGAEIEQLETRRITTEHRVKALSGGSLPTIVRANEDRNLVVQFDSDVAQPAVVP